MSACIWMLSIYVLPSPIASASCDQWQPSSLFSTSLNTLRIQTAILRVKANLWQHNLVSVRNSHYQTHHKYSSKSQKQEDMFLLISTSTEQTETTSCGVLSPLAVLPQTVADYLEERKSVGGASQLLPYEGPTLQLSVPSLQDE